MGLEGKVVLITGGGSGVGASVAIRCVEQGAQVVIAGRREEQLRAVCETIGTDLARFCVADVTDRAQVAQLVEWTVSQWGRINVLVNNVGANVVARRLSELEYGSWDALMDVNAISAFNMIHAVLPHMRAQREGLVISISSIAGCRPSAVAGAAYSAAKHAMAALTRVVGLEEADNGIRATTIFPGEINTAILDQRPVPVSDEHRERILQPDDVAAAVLFVAALPPHVSVPELVITPTVQAFA